MKNSIHGTIRPLIGILTLITLLPLCGCLNLEPVEDQTSFYVLSLKREAFVGEIQQRISIRSVELVDYLENSQIVQRAEGNEILYLPEHRWAGDLDMMIGMVIADEIEKLKGGTYVTVGESLNADYKIDLKVLNFDITNSGQSAASLEWAIVDASTRGVVNEGRTEAVVSGEENNPSGKVAALEAALRQITATIADSL